MFYLPHSLPPDHVARFAMKALPPMTTLGDTPLSGWVTGRHLMDRNINEDTAHYAGYLRLALATAERKIPAATLKAECRMEELARMQAEGRAELDRKTRSEIRKEIEARLLPTMPPQLKGMDLVHLPESGLVYCEATNGTQIDRLDAYFREVMRFGLIPVTPYSASFMRLKFDARDLGPSSFSPDCDDDSAADGIGNEFLTWLWFVSETRGGVIKLPDYGDFALLIEGPLTFVSTEGSGAHEAVLRQGTPTISTEAKIALLSGKKLSKARIMLARGQDTWQVTLDAEEFIFRGLKLPEGEKLEPISRFQERMTSIGTFTGAFLEIFDLFMIERKSEELWKATKTQIHQWVSERTSRR
jgi:recombination associated protein RdgC